jgi:Kef-type K+ transport system membrane component KefB
MSDPGFFQSALVYLTAAVISVPIAKRLGLGLFFISVGASMDLQLILKDPLGITLLLAGFVLIKGSVLAALGKLFQFAPGATPLYPRNGNGKG